MRGSANTSIPAGTIIFHHELAEISLLYRSPHKCAAVMPDWGVDTDLLVFFGELDNCRDSPCSDSNILEIFILGKINLRVSEYFEEPHMHCQLVFEVVSLNSEEKINFLVRLYECLNNPLAISDIS
jgi:hypothetical protein